MSYCNTLFLLSIEHDYFHDSVCRAINVELSTEPIELLRRRGLIWKRIADNRWALIKDMYFKGFYDETDKLIFKFHTTDLDFMYYTDLNATGINDLKTTLSVAVSEKEKILRFSSKKVIWEYLFIQRRNESYEREFVFEEVNKKLSFSKPEIQNLTFTDSPAWLSRSTTAVKMKDFYDYKLELGEVLRAGRLMKKKILGNIPSPTVKGAYLSEEKGVITQIVYIN
ncbi:MAG: hypothetical protein LBM07_02300 [Culturomica sp.]|nr:hypothetical protein [Culturomica sp.]